MDTDNGLGPNEASDLERFVAHARATRQRAWSTVERLQAACVLHEDASEESQAMQLGWLDAGAAPP